MKKLLSLFAIFLMVISSAWAQTAKAVFSGTTCTFYYDSNDYSGEGVTVYNITSGSPGWYTQSTLKSQITTVVFDSSFDTYRPASLYRWFDTFSNLTTITGMSYLHTDNVTNMESTFYHCKKLASLDLSNFNTSKVSTMGWMFCGCPCFTSLNVSSFNTEKVTNMNSMFCSCGSLTSLDVSNFNTEKVTNMNSMFYNSRKLTSLDLSNFNTSEVTNMERMFACCYGLTSLTLGSNFNTEKVTNMKEMFLDCDKLAAAPFVINPTSGLSCKSMFSGCSSLKSVNLNTNSWDGWTHTYWMSGVSGSGFTFTCPSDLPISWGVDSIPTGALVNPVTVTFDANGGTCTATSGTVSTGKGLTYGTLPTSTRTGYSCGWYTAADGGTEVTATTEVQTISTSNHTLYAHWTPNTNPSITLNSAGYATYSTYFNAHIETEGVKAYKAEVSGTTITLTELDGDIPAGTGVLLYGEGKGGAAVTFSASAAAATNATGNALKATTTTPGVLEAIPAGKVIFALDASAGNVFKNYTGASFVHNRAYFEFDSNPLPSSAKGLILVFADGDTTGIASFEDESGIDCKRLENGRLVIVKNGKKYNLNGQEVK